MTQQIITTEAEQAAQSVDSLVTISQTIEVSNQEQYHAAEHNLAEIIAKKKELNELRLSMTRPLDASKKQIMDFFRMPVTALEGGERVLRQVLTDYTTEQERKAAKKQAEIDERARKEKERLAKQADKAEQSGKVEKAEALREHAETVTPTQVAPAVQKTRTTTRTTWTAEVVDIRAVLQGVLDGKIPEAAIGVNMPVLNKMAVALKDQLNYPGVKAVAKKTTVAK